MATENRTVSDEQILDEFRESGEPFMTVPEVANRLPVSRQAIHKRVNELHENGELEKKETGHTTLWWLPDQEFP